MSLTAGMRVGPYEILTPLGAGGMGEVYRARDTKLGRDVAIKVLPDGFALDPERLARFKREAQLLASLNHPNIAAIHGLEDSTAVVALVLELVDGPTLADRIAEGPIAWSEALPVARQIVDAVEAAHERGIIHRDLKPANIKIRADGTVKVLDFGLAKLRAGEASAAEMATAGAWTGATNSPTLTTPAMTQVGSLLGTAAYMSPEQAKGRPADKRSDVWAFGCVLFEMLTSKRAFEGEDVSDTLAAVLRAEPDWTAFPSDTPPAVCTLVRRCLEKDPRRRIADISTARFVFDEASIMGAGSPAAAPPAGARPRRWRNVALATSALIVVAALAVAATQILRRDAQRPAPVMRFSMPVDGRSGTAVRSASISPDGTKILYLTDRDRLFVRSLSEASARPLAATDAASNGFIAYPTFSPDGESIVFWYGDFPKGELKRVAINGGPVQPIASASYPFGLSWDADGIVYSQIIGGSSTGILRLSPNGGKPEQLVALKPGEFATDPQLIPGQNALLFTDAYSSEFKAPTLAYWDKARIVVQSLSTGRRTVVVDGGSAGRYLPTGHLVYAVGTRLLGVPFDVKRQQTTGAAVTVLEQVLRPALGTMGPMGNAVFSMSDTGSLIYATADQQISGAPATVLALTNRKGEPALLKLPPGPYEHPRVSPDGKRIVYDTDDGTDAIVWTYDLSGVTSPLRITFGGRNRYPVWTPDGERIAFQSTREGDSGIFWQRADGNGVAERLTKSVDPLYHEPEAWSRSAAGDVLLFAQHGTASSLQTLSLADRKVTPFGSLDVLPAPVPPSASFSPDGRWVVYSVGSGTAPPNVYVQPFPATGAKYQIASGALYPAWSRDGKELFFASSGGVLNRLNGVNVTTQPTFAFAPPMAIEFTGQSPNQTIGRNYDVLPDGRFIFLASPSSQPASSAANLLIQVVVNWAEELKQRVPIK